MGTNVSVGYVSFSIWRLISLTFRQCLCLRSPEEARPGGGCQELFSLVQFRHPLSLVLVGGALLLDHRWKLSFRLLSAAHGGAFALETISANCSSQVKFCFETGRCN